MVTIKTPEEIAILREGGRRLAELLATLAKELSPGVSSLELDSKAHELIVAGGDKPSFLGYKSKGSKDGFPGSICFSANNEIVHGAPSIEPHIIKEGDIITIDGGLIHKGLYTDSAITLGVGKISETGKKIIAATSTALEKGIAAACAGGHIGDIGAAIEEYVKTTDFSLTAGLSGHGVGYSVHEDPYVPNWGERGKGEELRPGLVIAIEPMLNEGTSKTKVASDGFTICTADGKLSAHFEHTIVIGENGPEVLTKI